MSCHSLGHAIAEESLTRRRGPGLDPPDGPTSSDPLACSATLSRLFSTTTDLDDAEVDGGGAFFGREVAPYDPATLERDIITTTQQGPWF